MVLDKLSQTTRRVGLVARLAVAARSAAKAAPGDREAAQRALAVLMADARGVPLKIGQIMGTLGQGAAYTDLSRGIEAQPMSRILPAVEAALNAPLESVFSAFEEQGIAASLGQVHKARLLSGEVVAVKVRYPDIVEAIDAEMRLAKLLPGMGAIRKWGFDLDGYKRVLQEDMGEELDYCGELTRQKQFGDRMQISGLVTPKVFPEYSSESLLVQSWEDGIPLDELGDWPEVQREHVGVILMCSLVQSLFVHGTIHGDPHLGNYRFRRQLGEKPEVVLLDYGCMVPVPRMARLALLKMILGAIEGNDADPLACFQAMGFDVQKLKPIQPVLSALAHVLVEPFTVPTVFSLSHWQLCERVDALLGELKWWFRAAGPPNLLLLLRAFHGLMAQLETLQVSLPWQRILYRTVGAQVQQEARELPLPPLPVEMAAYAMNYPRMARYLKVQICEGGRQVAWITMPASQVTLLEEIIPEDTLEKLQQSAIDLAGIKARVCASGIVPQTLFEHHEGDKTHRVWLE